MKIIAKRRVLKMTASALIVCMLLCAWAPSAHAGRNICKKAASKCLIDAVIALILAGPHTAAIYASGCINGYIWCLTYYE